MRERVWRRSFFRDCAVDRVVGTMRVTTIFSRSRQVGDARRDLFFPVVALVDRLVERLALRLALEPADPDVNGIVGLAAEAAGDHHALGDLERDDLLFHDLEPFRASCRAGPCIGAVRRRPSPPLLSRIPSGVADLRRRDRRRSNPCGQRRACQTGPRPYLDPRVTLTQGCGLPGGAAAPVSDSERSGPIVPCGGITGKDRAWHCPITRCASFSKPACISAITRGAGTRRWRPTSSASATASTSSTSSRPCRCCGRALRGDPRRRRRRRPRAVRRHQAPGAGGGRRGGQALRPVLRQLPLARRHADQLQDDLALDQAAARARGARHQPSRAA